MSINSRAYVARFNFRGPQQQKKVGQCSGGERNRIHLAKMLRRGGNLLLLGRADQRPGREHDAGVGAGADRLSGCAMVISHDRFFLDRICTHLLVMEGNGGTRWFEGNFAAYEEAVMAENPERLAHRRGKYQRPIPHQRSSVVFRVTRPEERRACGPAGKTTPFCSGSGDVPPFAHRLAGQVPTAERQALPGERVSMPASRELRALYTPPHTDGQ